jgi:DNA-binding transcriptional ArsR family regulator
MFRAMSKLNPTTAVLKALQNPTKLKIILLLMNHPRLTVTQMSGDIGVSKANLYHFTAQMVRDGLLTVPEVEVKGNYVEKYYRLKWGTLASVDPAEQRKKVKSLSPAEQSEVLRSFLVSVTLMSRKLAEEVGDAGEEELSRIHSAFKDDRLSMTYMTLPDEIYTDTVTKLRKFVDEVREASMEKKLPFRDNRIVILGVPQLKDAGMEGH